MEKLQKKKWLFLIAAVVFLAIWIVLGISSRSSKPEAVVQQLFNSYMKQDVNKIVKCYPPERQNDLREELRAELALGGFENSLSDLMTGYELIMGDVVYGEGEEADTAEVSCAIVQRGLFAGTDFNTLSLVKIGNKWYIDE